MVTRVKYYAGYPACAYICCIHTLNHIYIYSYHGVEIEQCMNRQANILYPCFGLENLELVNKYPINFQLINF
jgi:hypothetical protein